MLEQIKEEEADKGYFEEDTSDEDEQTKEEKEDLYAKPLDIDMNLVKQKAAQLLGVPVSQLPIAKGAQNAAELTAKSTIGPVHAEEKVSEVLSAQASSSIEE